MRSLVRRATVGTAALAAVASLAFLAPSAIAAPAAPVPPAPAGWTYTGGDEFDGPSLDTGRWSTYDSVGAFGNGLRRPSAITQGTGC